MKTRILIGIAVAALLAFGVTAVATSTRSAAPLNAKVAASPQLYALTNSNGSYAFSPVPTPTVTVTATPAPAPTITVTASPSPTPTKTATPSPTPAPGGSTIEGQTFTAYTVPAGTHNVTYDRCTFTSSSSSAAALTLNQACYGLTFSNCTFSASAWNDVTLNVTNGNIHDIAFTNDQFAAGGRMGLECTQRPTSNTVGYTNIVVTNCTFQPVAEEALSFDGGYFRATGDVVSDE